MSLVTEMVCALHTSPVKYVACKSMPLELFPVLLVAALAIVCLYPERKRERAGR